MTRPPSETPSSGTIITTMRMRNPYCSSVGRICQTVRGFMSANITFEPSRGGIGIRLKMKSATLMKTNMKITLAHEERRRRELDEVERDDRAKHDGGQATAISRFETGPAAATQASARRPPRSIDGLTGVGFAHPMKKPAPTAETRRARASQPGRGGRSG